MVKRDRSSRNTDMTTSESALKLSGHSRQGPVGRVGEAVAQNRVYRYAPHQEARIRQAVEAWSQLQDVCKTCGLFVTHPMSR